SETPEEQKKRFEIECEFVQALANPHYLNFLAQRGFFKERYFLNYLKYLLYWRRPEYARALKYPQCLHFLHALQNPEFREAIAVTANAKFIEDQQILQWQYYTRKRQRLHVCTYEKILTSTLFISKLLLMRAQHLVSKKMKQLLLQPRIFLVCLILTIVSLGYCSDEDVVDLPDKCEACVIFARELESQLHSVERKKGAEKKRDELTLIEILDKFCDVILQYKVHKEKQGLDRFQKAESQTMKTLHKLKDRGVKVELGIPYDLWDQPSAEVVFLKQQCDLILEEYENAIERWYYLKQRSALQQFLCEERVLKGKDASCIKRNSHSDL
ncbi:unnamed protein product, partial [Enterobius vermicularis]|uniref:Mediator of RNA polymerase II transcription subunit 31 n=1 Tax=Enterobius vermicularis TaxID=51028 RepID=A0A0N4VBT7_ENTVE